MLNMVTAVYSAENTQNILSDLGVKFHGAVMNIIPKDYAAYLHTTQYQPFSVCVRRVDGFISARICALDDEASIICDALEEKTELTIYGMDSPLVRLGVRRFAPVSADEPEKALPEKFRLKIVTPAVIKVNKVPSCPPEPVRYFNSTAGRYSCFESQVDFDSFRKQFSALRIDSYSLQGGSYNIGGSLLPGMTGYMDLSLPEGCGLLRKLIAYSQYSGIGAKTAMGMGAVETEPL